MPPYDIVVKRPLPCAVYGSFEIFKLVRRQKQEFADEFLAMVTEGVVQGVYNVLTQSSNPPFVQQIVSPVIPSGGKHIQFYHCITRLHTNLG